MTRQANRLDAMDVGEIDDIVFLYADDLATAILLATNRPVLVAPAMNPLMWANAATKRNVAQLVRDGIAFIGPTAQTLRDFGDKAAAKRLAQAAGVDEAIFAGGDMIATLTGYKKDVATTQSQTKQFVVSSTSGVTRQPGWVSEYAISAATYPAILNSKFNVYADSIGPASAGTRCQRPAGSCAWASASSAASACAPVKGPACRQAGWAAGDAMRTVSGRTSTARAVERSRKRKTAATPPLTTPMATWASESSGRLHGRPGTK